MTLGTPPAKRLKLDSHSDDGDLYGPEPPPENNLPGEDTEEEHCSICLQPLSDRTIIPACSHEFCFECLLVWTEQSRRCPLCSGQIGGYLIHDIRSKYDFSKHYLNPLPTSPRPEPPLARAPGARVRIRRSHVRWGRDERRERERQLREADELERAIEKRRWVYRHKLFAKHVASNSYTRYRPFPTPTQFASNPDLISRATIFVRRELRVWDALDVEFLTTFTISLMKSIDIRSESAVKLLAEFLDMDTGERVNAEHFAHELYCYLRSPYRDISRYDAVVQYDIPQHIPPLHHRTRSRRWETNESPLRSTSPSPGPSRVSMRSRSRSSPHEPTPPPRHARSGQDRSVERSDGLQLGHRNSLDEKRPYDDHDPLRRNGTPDHGDIVIDVKGKGRAVDRSDFDDTNYITDLASDVDAATVEDTLSGDSGRQPSTEVTSRGATTIPARVSSPVSLPRDANNVGDLGPHERLRDRPRLRRDALQAVDAHLLHSPVQRRAARRIDSGRQESLIGPSASERSIPIAGISIRGAAKAAAPAPPAPATSSTELSHEPNGQISSKGSDNPGKGMSSREIMARTRARLAKLRQEPTLSVALSSERAEHDASSLDAPSAIVALDSPAVASNQSGQAGSSPPLNSISSDVPENSAAQSSSGHSPSLFDEPYAASALRVRLLSKLDAERLVCKQPEDLSESTNATPMPVGIDSKSRPVTTDSSSAVCGPSDGKLSCRRDAQTLETSLRAQARLRVKLAAAKRKLADAGAELSSATINLETREEYLRSRLKSGASR